LLLTARHVLILPRTGRCRAPGPLPGHHGDVLLAEVAGAVEAVTVTSSRRAKVAHLAAALKTADAAELPVVARYLAGELPQRRTGLGWRSLQQATAPPAPTASLTVADVDAVFADAERETGAGSQARRRDLLHGLLRRATPAEQRLLAGLVSGELRQGAQRGLLADAVADAAGVPAAAVRRAVLLSGAPAAVAVTALTAGETGLAAVRLQVGRPLSPMLAQSAPDLADPLPRPGPAGVEW
jgi:DNA ligase-1